MPDPKPAVVPSDAGLRPVTANQTLAADPAGVVHAESVAPVLKDPDGNTRSVLDSVNIDGATLNVECDTQ